MNPTPPVPPIPKAPPTALQVLIRGSWGAVSIGVALTALVGLIAAAHRLLCWGWP